VCEFNNSRESLLDVLLGAFAASVKTIKAQLHLDFSEEVSRDFSAVRAISGRFRIEGILSVVVETPDVLTAVDIQ